MTFQKKLLEILTKEQIFIKEPMSRHTTFRVGGCADFYLKPEENQIPQLLALCRSEEVPVQIIGNGSNLLVGDKGIRGVVIEIGSGLSQLEITGERMMVQAGVTLARAAFEAAKSGLSGLEFASGIPGTVGGAVVMNAGAYGGEIKDILESATILTEDGRIEDYAPEALQLSYRHSIVPQMGGTVLRAVLRLQRGNEEEIRQKMEELRCQRNQKQPLEFPSAGSTFKRPEGQFAGKLIMDAGLRGYRVGDAQVSEKHCGFVVNRGNATAAEILKLMEDVQAVVQRQFGVSLEPEVKLLGEF